MTDCIFCKILNKELPAHIVYEDDHALAIMDIFPTTPGQVIILTKKHEPYLFHFGDEEYTALMTLAKKITGAIDKAFKPVRTCLVIEGFEVDHTHLKLFPCYEERLPYETMEEKPSNEELDKQAEQIKEQL